MRKTILLLFLFLSAILVKAQDKKDTTEIKTGFTFGALPAIAYDSDVGFRYGALTNLYWFGDGSQYPDYRHSVYLEWSKTTKGSGQTILRYDSDYLIPKVRINLETSLFTEKALDFYGFNGASSFYDANFTQSDAEDYISRVYYKQDRKWLMLKSDFWGDIIGKKLRWYGGFQFNKVDIASVDVTNINDDLKEGDQDWLDPNTDLLYDKYVNWGLIADDQKNGGNNTQLKVGMVYDTRDEEPNPTKGVWTEAIALMSPGFLGNDYSYSQLIITHRHYFTLVEDVLSFAGRFTYQGKLSGEIPAYMLPFYYITSNTRDGLGGAKTIRGILRNRVVGESVGLTNLEFRWKFFKGKFLGQNLYLALSTFYDGGLVLKDYELDLTTIPANEMYNFTNDKEYLHSAAGLGFHFVMNRNFIVAVDYGKALNPRDGNTGLYIGLNFLY